MEGLPDWYIIFMDRINDDKPCGGHESTALGGLKFVYEGGDKANELFSKGLYQNGKKGLIGWKFNCRGTKEETPRPRAKCCKKRSTDENYKWGYVQEIKEMPLDC